MKARFARLDDDLTGIWPEMIFGEWNRDQAIVAEDAAGAIIGGLLFLDAGHPILYVESVRGGNPPTSPRR